MALPIIDGTGGGFRARVFSDNRLSTRSLTETSNQEAVRNGKAWNINTGLMTISSNSALLYFFNDEAEPFFINDIAIGLTNGSATDIQHIYGVSNPTGGTLVAAATDCDIIQNRRVADGQTFRGATSWYKSTATGQTLTGGSDSSLFFVNDQDRLFAALNFDVPPSTSFGIRMDIAGGFSGQVYAAVAGHKRSLLL